MRAWCPRLSFGKGSSTEAGRRAFEARAALAEHDRSIRCFRFMHTHHAIDYIEFPVLDIGASKAFYAAAFGWRFTDYGPDYAGICGPEREVGGFCRVTEIRTGGTLVVLFSSDLDVSLCMVRAAGGTIVKEPFAFPGGRRFHFVDPSGNELAVWAER